MADLPHDHTQADLELIAELDKAAAVMAEDDAPAPVPAVTRDQVRALVAAKDEPGDADGDRWLVRRERDDPWDDDIWDLDVDALTDAVMALLAEAPQPKVLTTATLVHESLPHGGFRGHVIVDDNSIWDLPANTRVAVVALGPPVPETPEGVDQ